jgi:uncharacterized protein (TIGR00369 family)
MTRIPAAALRAREHPHCVACSNDHPFGLRMTFHRTQDDWLTATVECNDAMQGYAGLVHGGIVSLMLDAAMTNCLFEHGVSAMTAQLTLRFMEPLKIGATAEVSARMARKSAGAFVLEGHVLQDGTLKAKGEGVFMRKPLSGKSG